MDLDFIVYIHGKPLFLIKMAKNIQTTKENLMGIIKKIAREMASPFDHLTVNLIKRINLKEYLYPPFNTPNERSVEYCFVFEQITKYYPKTILDVGTGTTALPHLMANCGFKVTAIDNVKDYWTNGMFNRHYHVIDENITNPKLSDTFDMIVCVSALEHIDKYNTAVHSMFNLLKNGGHLVLTFPYNDKKGVENVYTLPNSEVKQVPNYKTRAFCYEDIENWKRKNRAIVIKQEFWQFYTGEYWTTGERLPIPKSVDRSEKHQISCILFEKM